MSTSVPGSAHIACVQVPHLSWQIEAKRRPGLAGRRPAIIVQGLPSHGSVLDHSPGLAGVAPGMPIAEALSRHKGAELVEADLPHYHSVFEEMLQAIEQRVPEVEGAGLGHVFVRISGLEGLYGGDARVVQVLASAVPLYDLRIGVGENKWLAYMAALTSRSGSARKISGEHGRFLEPVSVDLLPLPCDTIERLRSFGLHTMGDIAALPRGAMASQLGQDGALAWDLANGIDDRPLVPRRVEEKVSEYLQFPDATSSMFVILPAVESLLAQAYGRPQLARRQAREAVLEAQVFRRPPWTLRVAFKEPSSKNRALFAIKSRLDAVALPGPVEDLRLTLSGLTGEVGRQESMWREVRRDAQLQEAVSQLRSRLNITPPIYQVKELEPWSRIPERRHALVQLR